MSPSLTRLWPQRVRTRLTVLYALLFLAAGSGLLALTYTLLANRLPNTPTPVSRLPPICKQVPQPKPTGVKTVSGSTKVPGKPILLGEKVPDALVEKCKLAFAAGATAGSQAQRDRTLNSLLLASLIGLGVITIASGGLGWFLAGRALRPVRRITETARRASELHLGDRIALAGPADELKDLADTFDEMLERLDAAFTSQKRFVANAAHELRTPLTAMRTSIDVTLSKPSRTPEQLEAMAAKVRRSIERTEATVDALLMLATSERGPATHELVDLATAAEDALDLAAHSIAERGLTLNTALKPALSNGDPVLLERMIGNLVDNAVQHNTPGGWIRVCTGERDGNAVFEVANSGPHVPEQTIPMLFEPFGRARQRLDAAAGIGLGLSIANAIGTAHGATLSVHGRPDGGLDVSILLPRAPATAFHADLDH
jgi:signal transduction histidine kinase